MNTSPWSATRCLDLTRSTEASVTTPTSPGPEVRPGKWEHCSSGRCGSGPRVLCSRSENTERRLHSAGRPGSSGVARCAEVAAARYGGPSGGPPGGCELDRCRRPRHQEAPRSCEALRPPTRGVDQRLATGPPTRFLAPAGGPARQHRTLCQWHGARTHSDLADRAGPRSKRFLRRHGLDETFLAASARHGEVRIARRTPTRRRRNNEFAFHERGSSRRPARSRALSLRMSSLLIGKLAEGSRFALAAPWAVPSRWQGDRLTDERSAPAPSPRAPATGDVFH